MAPSLAGVNRLRPLLTEYSGLPGVNTVSNVLNTLAAAQPQMVIDFNTSRLGPPRRAWPITRTVRSAG